MSDPYRERDPSMRDPNLRDPNVRVVNSGSDSGYAVIAGIAVAAVLIIGGLFWLYNQSPSQIAANDRPSATITTPGAAPSAPSTTPAAPRPTTPAPAPAIPPASGN
jgi:hypothetical protein